jgi:hypothetical protein
MTGVLVGYVGFIFVMPMGLAFVFNRKGGVR